MAIFPEIAPSYDYTVTVSFKTLKLGPTDGDYTQRRRKRLTPLHSFKLTWDTLSPEDEATLYNFYVARSGSWEAFSFFDFDSYKDWAVTLGTGDTFTTNFDLGGKDTDDVKVYVDGTLQTITTDYTISTATGTDDQDQIIFQAGHIPAASMVITATWTGRRYFPNCIFDVDDFDRTTFSNAVYKTGITITEVSS